MVRHGTHWSIYGATATSVASPRFRVERFHCYPSTCFRFIFSVLRTAAELRSYKQYHGKMPHGWWG
jgi:hypothetical protein